MFNFFYDNLSIFFSEQGEAQVQTITSEADYTGRVQRAGSKLVLAQFSVTWCGHCRRSIPVVRELAQRYASKMDVLYVDGDKFPNIWKYGKHPGYPAFIFLKNGQVLDTMAGWNEAMLKSKIERLI